MGHEDPRERAKAIWSTGDYGPTSRQLEPASAALVDALQVTAGQRVLDVAAGHGNCALAAARRGASVCASDFAPVMIAAGRRRTASAGLDIEWQEADATDLPFDDGSFDRVTSVFGMIFAPDPTAAASEAVRVSRRGGMVGLTSWTDDGVVAQLIAAMRRYAPPTPADAPDPLWWGRPGEVRALFRSLGCDAVVRDRTLVLRYASWMDWREAMEAHGMSVIAKQTMPPDTYEGMFEEVRHLIADHNRGENGTVEVDYAYLEVLATKP